MQSDRRRKILELVQTTGSRSVGDLRDLFGVSEMTIRRDLSELAREGMLRRVHGGAISNLGRSYEPPYAVRSTRNEARKRWIGRKAADLILNGDSVALDVGTTTIEVARALNGKRDLTIITAGLRVAEIVLSGLSLTADVRLILTGGVVRPGELSMTGHIAERTYADFHVDKGFVGVAGISVGDGLTEFNLEDALVKRHLMRNAHQRIVVADSDKLGKTTLVSVGPLASIQTLITDIDAPTDLVDEFTAAGIEVLLAGPDQELTH
jgi:DeoR/GlpR family transcriptional regulator of sugar metabolism